MQNPLLMKLVLTDQYLHVPGSVTSHVRSGKLKRRGGGENKNNNSQSTNRIWAVEKNTHKEID